MTDDDAKPSTITKDGGFMSSILNNLVFYGLDKLITKKVHPTRKVFYSKSPFLTISESIAQQIINEVKQEDNISYNDDDLEVKNSKDDDYEEINSDILASKTEIERNINSLQEELNILDVTLDDLKQNNEPAENIAKLIETRHKIQKDLEDLQIESINQLLNDE